MNNSVNRVKSLNFEKLAFYSWIFQWISDEKITTEDVTIDVPQFAVFMQTMGFKLEMMDQAFNKDQVTDSQELKIEVMCSKSGMRAVLSKQMEICNCPSPEIANKGQFWVVNGTGPSRSQDNLNKIDETHSNLIPSISKEKLTMVKDVLNKLCAIIIETDVNQNEKAKTTIKQSWIVRSRSDLCKSNSVRQDTWEVDPKTSPPIITSSPLSLTESTCQSWLNNDKEQLLSEILHVTKENLEKALILLPQRNTTFTKTNVKRVSNIKSCPTVKTPTRSTIETPTSNVPIGKTPRKVKEHITPKSDIVEKRHMVTSKIGSIRKKTDLVPSPQTNKKLTKTNSLLSLNKIVASTVNIGAFEKKKINADAKTSSLRGSCTNLPGNSGIKTFKTKTGIPSFGFQSASKSSTIMQSKKSK